MDFTAHITESPKWNEILSDYCRFPGIGSEVGSVSKYE